MSFIPGMPRTVAGFVHSLIKPAVEDWFVKQCYDPGTPMYMFYKPAGSDRPGIFTINSDQPGPDWEPVSAEPVRTDFTKEQVQRWIYDRAGSLPILPDNLDLAS
ncbi:hypothetical protein [Marinobacter sp. P4B1]|uniref:hypothetical protein n=1 Tax=Marinobacter sp. P4B1 TaxID=1119533 RepID=UPI00071DE22E|nr:hypothetical protein [Marinobacter sp. P4B1]KRW83703.1 hypothetical protein AQ621_16775 [Marinobacter sp. P4B1]